MNYLCTNYTVQCSGWFAQLVRKYGADKMVLNI